MNLKGTYRTYHPKTTEYTFFSSAYGPHSRIDRVSGYKTILNKFKKTEIVPRIFFLITVLKLDINHAHTQI